MEDEIHKTEHKNSVNEINNLFYSPFNESIPNQNLMHNQNRNSEAVDQVQRQTNTQNANNLFFEYKSNFTTFAHLEPGDEKSAVFSIIVCCLGLGIFSLPYLALVSGIVVAFSELCFGAFLSYFCGMLLVYCSDKVKSVKYEQIAQHCFGDVFSYFVSMLNIGSLLCFIIRNSLPEILQRNNFKSEFFCATTFTFVLLIPLCLPRRINALRYFYLISTIFCVLFVLCLIFLFFFDKKLVPDPMENLKLAIFFDISINKVVSTFSLTFFLFFYQLNIPIIYRELNEINYAKMRRVFIIGSVIVVLIYFVISCFGYLCVVNSNDQMVMLYYTRTILDVDISNPLFMVTTVGYTLSIFASCSLCILPVKDAIEYLFFGNKKMSSILNFIMTVILCLICYGFSIFVPKISDVISVMGCTAVPIMGYTLISFDCNYKCRQKECEVGQAHKLCTNL